MLFGIANQMSIKKLTAVIRKMPNSAFYGLSRKKTNAEVHGYLPSG